MLDHHNQPDFAKARLQMVESQLRPNRVTDEVLLTAMETTPREVFVPQEARGFAYLDEDIEIAPSRWLMEPMVFARLAQAASLQPHHRVLDVACATGYSTIILGKLAGQVMGIDRDKGFIALAQNVARNLGVANVQFSQTEPVEGFSPTAPYDAIFINGSVAQIPADLFEQLKDGGKLMTVYRDSITATGKARCYQKQGGKITHRDLFDASCYVVAGFEKPERFTFEDGR